MIVGSTHSGTLGRALPGATAERLLHGAPCPVAAVPGGYRTRTHPAFRRIGVAYDDSAGEAKAAIVAARIIAHAFDAELELIGVVSAELYAAPA